MSHGTSRKLDYLIIGVLVVALGYFTYDKFLLDPRREAALIETTKEGIQEQADSAADAQQSIAVLPFDNMSADPQQEYFVDGLAEELLNLLVGIPELRVAARTSSFSFRGQQVDIRTIGEKLKVKHVLEGSVRKSGNAVRISAHLVETDSGYDLWSKQFDRQIEDIFAIQDEIAAAVVDALKISLLGGVPKVEEISPEAYTLFLQARDYLGRRSREGLEKAVEAFQGVLKLEPEYALAWAGLGQVYVEQTGKGFRDTHKGMALARAAVERALELDDSLAKPHIVMGWILLYHDWNWEDADKAMQRALALDPGNSAAIEGAAVFAAVLGRLDEAIGLERRSIALDPLNPQSYANLGYMLVGTSRLEEGAAVFRHVLELDPQFPGAHYALGLVLLLQNEPEMALAKFEQETDPTQRDLGTVEALFSLGRTAEAERALAHAVEEYKESATHINEAVYAWIGNADEAFRWMDIAYAQRDGFLAEILSDPTFDKLKSDPRWPEFLDKMGLPH